MHQAAASHSEVFDENKADNGKVESLSTLALLESQVLVTVTNPLAGQC